MALFVTGETPCSLCGEPICIGDDIVGTTHFISDGSDPLYQYSDSVMHRQCFDAWEYREEFAQRYREVMSPMYPHVARYANFPGPRGGNIVKEPPPAQPPPPPTHFCPQCNSPLSVAKQGECAACGWLRYSSDRALWGTAGSCPRCGFAYRFDGQRCSHCGGASTAARPAT
jgi:hypothetical protein